MTTVKDRFLKYARIKTTSDPDSDTCPSSAVQFDLARVLEAELRPMGMEDVELDRNCYLMATLPANTDKPIPTIGFNAHMDTSPDMSGENVNPQIISSYDGGEIVLNPALNVRMSPDEFPELKKYVGQ